MVWSSFAIGLCRFLALIQLCNVVYGTLMMLIKQDDLDYNLIVLVLSIEKF